MWSFMPRCFSKVSFSGFSVLVRQLISRWLSPIPWDGVFRKSSTASHGSCALCLAFSYKLLCRFNRVFSFPVFFRVSGARCPILELPLYFEVIKLLGYELRTIIADVLVWIPCRAKCCFNLLITVPDLVSSNLWNQRNYFSNSLVITNWWLKRVYSNNRPRALWYLWLYESFFFWAIP